MPRSTPRDPNAIQSSGKYEVVCYDKDGNEKWRDVAHNALYNEGEQMILDVALRGGTPPSSFYIGLFKNSLSGHVETSTLADLKTGTNYELNNTDDPGYGTTAARKTVARSNVGWPTLALDSGDYQATSLTVSWTATADWTDVVEYIFLTSEASAADTTGKLYSLAQLSAERTLLNGDTLNVTYKLKLQ